MEEPLSLPNGSLRESEDRTMVDTNNNETYFGIDDNGDIVIDGIENNTFRLSTYNQERFTVLNTGNVGIGASNPNTNLQLYHATNDISINVNHGTGGSYPKKSGISYN